MTERERVIEKIRKLHEHSGGNRTEQEAQAFAAMVQQLLLKHKLSMTDIEYEKLEAEEPVGVHRIDYDKYEDLELRQVRVAWIETLAHIVARAHFCQFLVTRGSSRISLIGRKSDCEVAEFMLITLQRSIWTMSYREAHSYRLNCRATGQYYEPRFRQSYIRAFVSRLAERYKEELNRVTGAESGSTALVRVNRAALAVQQYVDERFKRRAEGLGGGRSGRSLAGEIRGRAAADAVELRARAVGSGEAPRAIGGRSDG